MFKFKLSPELLERIAAERREALRVFGLADRWLAAYLMQEARKLQSQLAAAGWKSSDVIYDTQLAWQIVPEIAKRLGFSRFSAQERVDCEIIQLSSSELRMRTSMTLANLGFTSRGTSMGRDSEDGNAVVFALDRLAAPCAAEPHVKRLTELASYRKIAFFGSWTSAFLDA